MKKFALIGVGGFIAPRHLKAIKETGNVVVAALDKSDSVGILDSYFPDTNFFTEFERFDRHLEKLRREKSEHVTARKRGDKRLLRIDEIRIAPVRRSGGRGHLHALVERPRMVSVVGLPGEIDRFPSPLHGGAIL